MPCDTISETEVEFSQHTDSALLKKAMGSLGFTVLERSGSLSFVNHKTLETGTFLNGRFAFNQRSTESNAIKRAYSEQVVKSQAKRFGWQLKDEKREGNQIKFKVRKQVL